MSNNPADFWTNDTSVFFTSFWGWSPRTWGCVGWTGDAGLSRRENLLENLSDPFIAVIYVTKSAGSTMDGKIAGFYLVCHETGHRNDFTDPCHHPAEPTKWEHSLRATRAFTYVPEHALDAFAAYPGLAAKARAIAKWGEIIEDRKMISRLQKTPWVEVEVYSPDGKALDREEELLPTSGYNRAGPANRNPYLVSSNAHDLKRQLYILCLNGCTDSFLGTAANGQRIYKVGVSASPDWRRQSLQSALPKGAFDWRIHRESSHAGGFSFKAAVKGEYAMKKHLAECATWLGGEFYLAGKADIETAWKRGCLAAKGLKKN